jgi:acetylornithine deacetylase/succinyl-diaminopimelate desuccinylase-like protein
MNACATQEDYSLAVDATIRAIQVMEAALDTTPTLVAFDHAWPVINHPEAAAQFAAWLPFLATKHVICMATVPQRITPEPYVPEYFTHFSTICVTCDTTPTPDYQRYLDIDLVDVQRAFLTRSMFKRPMLICTHTDTVTVESDFSTFVDLQDLAGHRS